MRFIYNGKELAAAPSDLYIGGKPEPGSLLDKFNNFSDKVIGWENEVIFTPFIETVKEIGLQMWDWFILNLPDIMGYSAVLAAICIIVGAMIGRGGMMKPLAIYAAALILSFCILGGV